MRLHPRLGPGLIVVGALVGSSVPAFATEPDPPEEGAGSTASGPAGLKPRAMLRVELGLADDRTSIEAMDGYPDDGLYSGSLPAGGPIDARSVMLRVLYGHLGFYGGIEMGIGGLRQAPAVAGRPDPALQPYYMEDRSHGPTHDGRPTGNVLFAGRVLGGFEQRISHLVLGAELALGGVGVTIGETGPGAPHVTDTRFVLDARARIGIWLNPGVSATLLLGTSLVREGDRTAGVMLGFTPFGFGNR